MIDTQSFTKKSTPAAERKRLNVGDIWSNSAKCNRCGGVVRSKNRHDYVTCSCGRISVDGGSWYAKRAFQEEGDFTDMIEMYDDVKE